MSFGAGAIADSVARRILASVAAGGTASEPALVVGVFGEWGSGKSRLMSELQRRVAADLAAAQTLEFPIAYTVPVPFNAWRYEREEHLIVPLLKAAQLEIRRAFDAGRSGQERLFQALERRLDLLADLVIAAGGVVDAAVTLPGGIAVKPGTILSFFEKFTSRRKAREEERKSEIDRLRSLQYDFLRLLRAVTGRDGALFKKEFQRLRSRARDAALWLDPADAAQAAEWARAESFQLNIVFLIDDLDRCLPDKAVEVLEAIKLFLEVPGCAFVLALDDEVVERGIAHRYRDYLIGPASAASATGGRMPAAPITGAEYLEKIVQLPVRLTRPQKAQVREYLAQRWPGWFDGAEGSAPRALCDLVADIVPAVPRKLVRAVELMQAYEDILAERGVRAERPTLAILATLQLFAPALYRFLRVRGADLLYTMALWEKSGAFNDLAALAREQQRARRRGAAEVGGHLLREARALLPALLAEVQHNRSGFDLRPLLAGFTRLDVDPARLQSYFVLFTDTQPAPVGAAPAPPAVAPGPAPVVDVAVAAGPAPSQATLAGRAWLTAADALARIDALPLVLPTARLEDVRGFIDGLLANEPEAWRNAITREAPTLAGHVLGEEVFRELLAGARQRLLTDWARRPGGAERVLDWLDQVGPCLTPVQAQTLASVAARSLTDAAEAGA
ncbi:MAG: P-loop NTPase fold protein [Aquabacterium sp.]